MAYSQVSDLLNGNVPIMQSLDPARFVDDATDEVDSIIGFRYLTPIDISDSSPVDRPARLMIKRIANFLATGRLMMAAGSAGQDQRLNRYAKSLVDQALLALQQIASGEIILPGAVANPVGSGDLTTGPLIYNVDAESNVEAFYDRILPMPIPGNLPYTYPVVPW